MEQDGGFRQVGFAYSPEQNDTAVEEPPQPTPTPRLEDAVDAQFTIPIAIPEGMAVPQSDKYWRAIEKTAAFIVQHGPQMEFVLKTKQRSNNAFDFLTYGHAMRPFYLFIIDKIKSGEYTPRAESPPPPPTAVQPNMAVARNISIDSKPQSPAVGPSPVPIVGVVKVASNKAILDVSYGESDDGEDSQNADTPAPGADAIESKPTSPPPMSQEAEKAAVVVTGPKSKLVSSAYNDDYASDGPSSDEEPR